MPSDEEIDKTEEIQVQQGDYQDKRETPAFAQEHAEKMRGRDGGSYQE